jgi:hypothetical protein
MAHGKEIWLGTFCNKVDAARAYDRKSVELFGEFAFTNFPQTAVLAAAA